MNSRSLLLSVLLGCAFSVHLHADDEPEIRLSKRQRDTILQQVVPAYQLSNPAMLLGTLQPLVAKMDDRYHAGANQLLAKNGFPAIEEMLTDARLKFVQQNMANQLPPPSHRELELLLTTLDERIQKVLKDQDAHPVMAKEIPYPKTLKKYKQLFWEIHVLNNRLMNASHLAEYGKVLSGAKGANKLSNSQISTDFTSLPADIKRRRQELEERSIELRLNRLRLATQVFKPFDPQNPIAFTANDRLMAAHILGFDEEFIKNFYKQRLRSGTGFIRVSLKDPGVFRQVSEEAQTARESAGELVAKTKLLYEAIHWWMRGRYGRGMYANGLMKGQEAMANTQAMFSLFMPRARPKPTDPAKPSMMQSPQVDRRHHYTWMTETRQIVYSQSSSFQGRESKTEVSFTPPPANAGKDYFY